MEENSNIQPKRFNSRDLGSIFARKRRMLKICIKIKYDNFAIERLKYINFLGKGNGSTRVNI